MAASTALGAAGMYGAAGYGGLAGAGVGGLGMLYSTSFLYAGFVGLGALWAAMYFGGYNGGGGGGYGGGGYGGGGYGGYGGHGGYGGYRGGGGYGGYGGYRGGGGYGGYRGGYGKDYGGGYGKGYGGGYNSYQPSSHYKAQGFKGHDKGHVKGKGHVHDDHCQHKRKRRSANKNIWVQDQWAPQETHHTFISQDELDQLNLQTARNNPRKVVELVHSSLQSSRNSQNYWDTANKDPEEERLLQGIRESDTNNCGLRLVCELAAIRDRPLIKEEWEILRFVRQGDDLYNRMYPGQGIGPNSSVLRDYKEAEEFGKRGGDCAERFRRCHVGASHMMNMITGLRRL